jgi:hypothetical protein
MVTVFLDIFTNYYLEVMPRIRRGWFFAVALNAVVGT